MRTVLASGLQPGIQIDSNTAIGGGEGTAHCRSEQLEARLEGASRKDSDVLLAHLEFEVLKCY
jgi:hypothetical protein